MNCQEASILLPELVDSELSAQELAEVQRHVGECAHCRENLAALQACWDALGRDKGLPVPAGFARKVRRRIERPRRIRRFAAAAAIFVILSGALLQHMVVPTSPPSTTVSDVEVIKDLDVLLSGIDVLEPMLEPMDDDTSS